MIKVTETIEIEEEAIETRAIYASGSGGQHINKTMTAIQLRFDITQAYSLPYDVQQRLIELAGSRVNSDFQVVITALRIRHLGTAFLESRFGHFRRLAYQFEQTLKRFAPIPFLTAMPARGDHHLEVAVHPASG